MDEKIEDKSIQSKQNHIKYYKSLSNVEANLQKEITTESTDTIITHLKNRINAINKDKTRIEQMFPDVDWNKI